MKLPIIVEIIKNYKDNTRHIYEEPPIDIYNEEYYKTQCGGFELFNYSQGTELDDERKYVLNLCPLFINQVALDIGCGRGELVFALAQLGLHHVVGIDLSQDSVDISRGDYDYPLLPIRTGDVVLDIGGNHGFFSTYAAYCGAKVYAFEPAKDCFEMLQHNARLNGMEDRITARPWAIGSANGKIELLCTDALGGGMNTISQKFAKNTGIQVTERYEVDCVTFDSLATDFGFQRVRVLKMDCEGAELEILRSINPHYREKIDLVALEYHPEAYPLIELLDLLLSWGTHQISFGNNHILFAASNSALRTASRGGAEQS